jgi:thiol-disulfide isomerase/thioredoxin
MWLKSFLKHYGLVSMVVVAGLFYYYYTYRRIPDIPLIGVSATDQKGNLFTPAEFTETPMIVHFYASWCGPCLREMPHILQFAQDHPHFSVILLTDDEPEQVARYNDHPRNVHFGRIESLKALGVNSIPLTYFLKPPGEIVKEKLGECEWQNPNFVTEIIHLAGK